MISLMFRSFGAEPPADLTGLRHTAMWLGALLFVCASVLILAVVNFFSLFFGVTIAFLGRDGVKYTFLHLFRRIPLVGVTLPILFGYAVWHNVKLNGFVETAFAATLTTVVAIALLIGVVMINSLGTGSMKRGEGPVNREPRHPPGKPQGLPPLS